MTSNDQPMDRVPPDGVSDDSDDSDGRSELENNIKSRATWLRLFYMLILCLLYGLSRIVIAAVVIIQFFHVLLQGERNRSLLGFGRSLAIYSFEVVDYLTFNREEKPFPFDSDWPTTMPEA